MRKQFHILSSDILKLCFHFKYFVCLLNLQLSAEGTSEKLPFNFNRKDEKSIKLKILGESFYESSVEIPMQEIKSP